MAEVWDLAMTGRTLHDLPDIHSKVPPPSPKTLSRMPEAQVPGGFREECLFVNHGFPRDNLHFRPVRLRCGTASDSFLKLRAVEA